MIKVLFYILIVVMAVNDGYAQQQQENEVEAKIHSFVQEKSVPPGGDFKLWRSSLMDEMKEKWKLSFSDVRVRIVVEIDGSLTHLVVVSDEWKPTEEMLDALLKMINAKGKWKPAMHNGEKVRSNYTVPMIFQI